MSGSRFVCAALDLPLIPVLNVVEIAIELDVAVVAGGLVTPKT